MTPRRRASVIAALAVAALSAAGCSSFKIYNPFKPVPSKSGIDESKAISLLELNNRLTVSEALKGQSFYLPAPQPQADWPLPGGTLEQSVENVDAAPEFRVAWRRRFGQASGSHADVMAPPIAADGKVFVMDAGAVVSAHDQRTGATVWRTSVKPHEKGEREGYGGGLAYDGGRIYVSSGFRLVAALDAKTGRLVWETRTDVPIHAAPTVANGRVYVVDVNDKLMTFIAADGRPDWTYQALSEPARILMASSPAVSNGTVVASFASGELVALRADNGTELWNQPLSHTTRTSALSEIRDIAGRPVIYKGEVFAISHANVMADTNLRTGEVRWQIPLAGFTSPWPAGDVVFAVDDQGRVVCASRDSGQIYWMTDLDAPPPVKKGKKPRKRSRDVWSSPIVALNRVILVSDKGQAVAIDAKTGRVEKRLRIGQDALIGPIAANGTIYVVTQKAELVAIR